MSDLVVAGHDRDEIGLLVFPTPQARVLPAGELASHIRSVLQRLLAQGLGSSHCPARAIVQEEPPNADAGEITDKGYINQRAVLARRSAALYAGDEPRVIRA